MQDMQLVTGFQVTFYSYLLRCPFAPPISALSAQRRPCEIRGKLLLLLVMRLTYLMPKFDACLTID